MKLKDILTKDFIITDLTARDKKDILHELVEFLEKNKAIKNKEVLLQSLMERESLGSTGIGENVAIPHAKSDEIGTIMTLFGRSKTGIDYDSLDQKPVYYVCLLVAPTNSTGLHLKALARISKILKNQTLRENVLNALNSEDIYLALMDEDEKLG